MSIILIQVAMFYKILDEIRTFRSIFTGCKLNTNKFTNIKFKHQFKNLNFYSMPESVSIAFRRRLLNVYLFIALIITLIVSIL